MFKFYRDTLHTRSLHYEDSIYTLSGPGYRRETALVHPGRLEELSKTYKQARRREATCERHPVRNQTTRIPKGIMRQLSREATKRYESRKALRDRHPVRHYAKGIPQGTQRNESRLWTPGKTKTDRDGGLSFLANFLGAGDTVDRRRMGVLSPRRWSSRWRGLSSKTNKPIGSARSGLNSFLSLEIYSYKHNNILLDYLNGRSKTICIFQFCPLLKKKQLY